MASGLEPEYEGRHRRGFPGRRDAATGRRGRPRDRGLDGAHRRPHVRRLRLLPVAGFGGQAPKATLHVTGSF